MTALLKKSLVVLLFFYSLSFSIFLTYGALTSEPQTNNLFSLLPFLPIILYFLREFTYQGKLLTSWRDESGKIKDYFRLRQFLFHGGPLLALTLLLYLTAGILIYLKSTNPTLLSLNIN